MTSSVGSFATRSCGKDWLSWEKRRTASTTEETAMEHGKHTFTFMGTAAGMRRARLLLRLPRLQRGAARPARTARRLRRPGTRHERRRLARQERAHRHAPRPAPPAAARGRAPRGPSSCTRHAHFDHLGGLGELEYLVQLVSQGPAAHLRQRCGPRGREHRVPLHDVLPGHARARPLRRAGARRRALHRRCPSRMRRARTATSSRRPKRACSTRRTPASSRPRPPSACAAWTCMAMDATFWKRNWSPDAHHSVQECHRGGLGAGRRARST